MQLGHMPIDRVDVNMIAVHSLISYSVRKQAAEDPSNRPSEPRSPLHRNLYQCQVSAKLPKQSDEVQGNAESGPGSLVTITT